MNGVDTSAHTADDPGSGGGLFIIGAAIVALIWANSPWQHGYDSLWHHAVGPEGLHLHLGLKDWVNDALMTVFFLLVGLEIKREVTSGHLAGRRAATLPVVAALGGMVVPALLYLAIAGRTASHGWGIPMATDIALAVSVLALAGKGVPPALRAFLLGLAVVDDIGAIVVIAVFYSNGVAASWLAIAAGAVVATMVMRRVGVTQHVVYVMVGAVLWYALHRGGVHPTIAGVAMGLLAPVAAIDAIEHRLHRVTNFVIVPVFALANSGVNVGAHALKTALHAPVAWGVFVGLLIGKPLGVLIATRVSTRAGLADPPANCSGRQLLGAGHAAGIGFTVALFVTELAFRHGNTVDTDYVADAKMAILAASVMSGVAAYVVLRRRPAA